MRRLCHCVLVLVLAIGLLPPEDASGQRRGGGARGGGSRGGGMSRSHMPARSTSRPSVNRGGGGSGGFSGGGANRGTVDRGSVDRGNIDRGNVNRDINRGDVNRNVNRDVNRDIDRNVDIDRDIDWDNDWGCCHYNHPIAAGVAIGAAAVTTAAILGSTVYSLPSSCTTVIVDGMSYQQCGSSWYQPQFVGTSTSYVVVSPPN